MDDRIYTLFLEDQFAEGSELARSSDLLELLPVVGSPPSAYVARFRSRGYLRETNGEIVEGNHFEVGIRFPPDYLRNVRPFEILTWLGPRQIFHPNVRPPSAVSAASRRGCPWSTSSISSTRSSAG